MAVTRLHAVLDAQGRRIDWTAQQLGVHRTTLSKWVNGHEPLPPLRARQLAGLLNVDVSEVSNGSDR